KPEHRVVEAPALVFDDQDDLLAAFKRDELNRDFVAVGRFQGPRAHGMPGLHKPTPALSGLHEQGYKGGRVTHGRMSGASGKVPAAIHVSPEAVAGGPLAKVRDGDLLRVNAETGELAVLVDAADWAERHPAEADLSRNQHGVGRELFSVFRH